MATSPNPFADEPLPDHVVRLRSAADPLDPYAAPPSADEYRPPANPGVGLWRDGNYVVMHLDVEFPRRCLATNEPTASRRQQKLSWSYAIDWSSRTLKLEFGISPAEQQRMKLVRRRALVIAAVPVAVFIVLRLFPEMTIENMGLSGWTSPIYFGLAAAFFGAASHAWNPGITLQFVRARKSYLWLSGAKPAFLESLQIWPGLK
jgi:hypothetical protein